jgi:hypothetical protein
VLQRGGGAADVLDPLDRGLTGIDLDISDEQRSPFAGRLLLCRYHLLRR